MDYSILLCLQERSIQPPSITPALCQLAASGKLLAIIDNDAAFPLLAKLPVPIPTLGILNTSLPQQNLGKLPYLCESLSGLDSSYLDLVYCRFYHLPYTIGQTKRTCLRELTQTDLPALCQIYQEIGSHPLSVTPPDPNPLVEADKLKAYQHTMYELYGFGLWGVFLQESGQLIGHCGIELHEECSHAIGELSYLIAPTYHQQGYAYEVCQEILRLAYEEFDFPAIRVRIPHGNLISLKLAWKLGFRDHPSLHNANNCSIRSLYHTNPTPPA